MTHNFQEIADAFRSDGALRDFYIHNTSRADWNIILSKLKTNLDVDCFTVDGKSRELPETFEEIERIRKEANPCLNIPVGGAFVCCHFFCHDQVEFDFRPEDYRTRARWLALSTFLQGMVDAVAKPGVVTYENAEHDLIETFEPQRKVEPASGDDC